LAPREVDEYILPTERRVLRVRQHWTVLLSPMTQTAFVLGLLFFLDSKVPISSVHTIIWYVALATVFRLTVFVLEWWIERIVITDKRVMQAKGIITHKLAMMPLSKVTDLTFERTLSGRMFGYGTMVVESAGQIQGLNRIDYMPRPDEVYEALTELIFGDKKQTRSYMSYAQTRPGRRV